VSQLTRCPRLSQWIVPAVAALLPMAATRAADPPRPVAVLSIASIDDLMGNFTYLTKLGGRADVGGFIQMAGASFVQDLDRTKPLGVLITIENDEPKGVGFLPVPNLDKALKVVRDKLSANIDDLGDGIKKLELGKGVYLKQQGEWLFFSDQPKHLANLPVDPVAMLGGLEKQYSVALRFFVQNVPQNLRDLGAFQLHSKIDVDMKGVTLDDPEIDGAFIESLRQELKESVNVLINQSDQITIGWAVDSQGGRMYLDLHATAVTGSALAQQWAGFASSRSVFTGFVVDDAAATFQGVARVSQDSAGNIRAVVEYLRKKAIKGIDRDPKAPPALKDIVNGVLDVVDQTVQEGKSEIGASVVLAPKSFKFVAGVHVADGRALADAFQKLYELAKQQPDVPAVKFYADKHRDIDLHTLTVPISERDTDARKMLGEELDVVVGTGPQSLYFALGENSDKLLKSAIDKSVEVGEQSVPPVHLHVAVRPLMAFLASLDVAAEKPAKMAELIGQARGGDSISFTVTPLENGIGCRLQVDEGVLEMLGKTAQPSGD
jgi:hypothetical protein